VRHVGRAVPALAFRVLRIDLDELREVATVTQRGRNRAHVGLESIRADLEALAVGSVAQALDKRVCRCLAASAQSEVQNQFGVSFDGNEAVGVFLSRGRRGSIQTLPEKGEISKPRIAIVVFLVSCLASPLECVLDPLMEMEKNYDADKPR